MRRNRFRFLAVEFQRIREGKDMASLGSSVVAVWCLPLGFRAWTNSFDAKDLSASKRAGLLTSPFAVGAFSGSGFPMTLSPRLVAGVHSCATVHESHMVPYYRPA